MLRIKQSLNVCKEALVGWGKTKTRNKEAEIQNKLEHLRRLQDMKGPHNVEEIK